MATLNQDQIKVLEQTRQRLMQLTQSLGSLINNVNQSDPLPAW
jgi:mediator of RNA polymerase II transcription subunit 8